MSIRFPPRPRLAVHRVVALVAFLLPGCTVLFTDDYTHIKYRFTRDQRARIEAGKERARALADDPHRVCLHWKAVAATFDEGSSPRRSQFEQYAEQRVSANCNPGEALLLDAQAAIRAANEAPNERRAQLAALESLAAFVHSQRKSAKSPDNLTLQDLLTEARPVLTRLSLPTAGCEDQLQVTSLMWSLGEIDAALARFTGPQRACLGAKETALVANPLRVRGQCDELLTLITEVWPRITDHHDQIQLLDLVMSCSDAYTMRRNFAFVPRDILLDYQALLDRRAADEAEAEWADQQARQTERCEDNCLTMYGETGVCMSSCRGETICVRNCRSLGNSCRNSCGF
ncbi:MAG: hypothetical protein ACRBN8_17610 [Nannocystales bacterium]